MDTISEQAFRKLCEDVYTDRHLVYSYHPNVSRREALMWMLLGCLVSLLSVPAHEQPDVYVEASEDPYGDEICEIVQGRAQTPFNPRPYLEELTKRLEE
ncbi:MAG: hypothetical protein WCB68_18000 [Pyrinomonadaceae bacterium]